MMKRTKYYWFILIALLITNACGISNPDSLPNRATAEFTSTVVTLPTGTPTETTIPTPIPTATATPHPLEIDAMRAREYPGSDIVIEQVLDPGVNYSRYYV
ncbi:MAG TPA: hypothetical protein VI753_13555, partial [Anaerolineales bacterium]|nr:hypothetical protein [Anaerolineales bacterium]